MKFQDIIQTPLGKGMIVRTYAKKGIEMIEVSMMEGLHNLTQHFPKSECQKIKK